MLFVPVVGDVIVHGDLFPDSVSQEAYGIVMPGNYVVDCDIAGFLLIGPEVGADLFSRGTVEDLPVLHGSR